MAMRYCLGENCSVHIPAGELVCEGCRNPLELERIRAKVEAYAGLMQDYAAYEKAQGRVGSAQRELDAAVFRSRRHTKEHLVRVLQNVRAILDEKTIPYPQALADSDEQKVAL